MLAHRIIEWLWWSKQQSIWSFLPFFFKLKAKLKREQFEKEKRRLACRARRAPKQKRRLEREEKKLKGNMSLPVNLSSDFQRSLVSFTTCWHCFPPPPLCPLEVERLGKKPCVNTKKLLVTPFKSDQDHSWLANRHHLLSKKTSSPKSHCSEFIPKYPKNTLFSANFNSAVLHSVKFIQTALFKFY